MSEENHTSAARWKLVNGKVFTYYVRTRGRIIRKGEEQKHVTKESECESNSFALDSTKRSKDLTALLEDAQWITGVSNTRDIWDKFASRKKRTSRY